MLNLRQADYGEWVACPKSQSCLVPASNSRTTPKRWLPARKSAGGARHFLTAEKGIRGRGRKLESYRAPGIPEHR
jgi:hypothetical protein